MKYLKRINESNESDITEDIKENFIYITDILGQPTITADTFAKSKRWLVKWKLGINLNNLQDASVVINKLKVITPELEDVISASKRLPDYNFNISLSDVLTIELIQKKKKNDYNDNYEIIKFDENKI